MVNQPVKSGGVSRSITCKRSVTQNTELNGNTWRLGKVISSCKREHLVFESVSGAGIKMEGLIYLQKYGIGGPEFGIKEESVTERGRQLFHVRP